jgi:ubiquinone/menaquinone biosynthesis C-methylase UbiE
MPPRKPSITQRIIRKLLPGFKTGHTRYVECVKGLFTDGCRWLDAGGGRRLFHDLYDGEQELVARAGRVTVCDADPDSLKDHSSVSDLICCDLKSIPLPPGSFDLITCGMVVEHLAQPKECINEMGRVLDRGGKLVIHTVNLWSYPTLLAILSKVIPFRKQLIARVTRRKEEDIFPTLYRCNTARTISKYVRDAGLQVEALYFWNSGLLFRSILPLLPFSIFECFYLKMTEWPILSRFRGQLLVIATKA